MIVFETIGVSREGAVAVIEFDHGKANEVGTSVLRVETAAIVAGARMVMHAE